MFRLLKEIIDKIQEAHDAGNRTLKYSLKFDFYSTIISMDGKRLKAEVKERSTKRQETPLIYAAGGGIPLDAIVLLCEAGSDLNAVNSVGTTALMEALFYGYCDIVDYLLTYIHTYINSCFKLITSFF